PRGRQGAERGAGLARPAHGARSRGPVAGGPLFARPHGLEHARRLPQPAAGERKRRASGARVPHPRPSRRPAMKIAYFTHSLASCWNHGNAHFLRGLLSELPALGCEVRAFEPYGAWSLENLLKDHGRAALEAWRSAYPDLDSDVYGADADLDALVEG